MANRTIELRNDQLIFRFPEVHEEAKLRIEFQRTLRIPDDNREHYLPPGLGKFPIYRVDDYIDKAPVTWGEHGGVFTPMYQTEAMWINFGGFYPMAVKIAAGKVNAISGEEWSEEFAREPQDYVVAPDQPWLDGFCVEKGLIRQFVAMPLGEGYTAEEQLTGEAEHGGIQMAVYPMKRSVYEERLRESWQRIPPRSSPVADEMGMAPGGLMRQEIYTDKYGFDAWDTSTVSRCFVHIVNSIQLFHLTGCEPPRKPLTAQDYTATGLPWFDYYGDDVKALKGVRKLAGHDSNGQVFVRHLLKALKGTKGLAQLDSVATVKLKKGEGFLPDNDPVNPATVKTLSRKMVREGVF